MRSVVFRISALATAIGVAAIVATGGRGCAWRDDGGEREAARPIASVGSALPAAPSAPAAATEEEIGIMGPATKADPHAIRRAVNGLATAAASSAAAH